MNSFQARLKRRHLLAAFVKHVAVRIRRRSFGDLELVVVELERRQLGQTRELLWYAAWGARHVFQSAKNTKALRPGADQLTVEVAVGHTELLEVRECAPVMRNSTSKLVKSFASIRVAATRQIKNLKRNGQHPWQRACAKQNARFSRDDKTAQYGC